MKKALLTLCALISINAFSQINSPNGSNIFSYNGAADVTFKYPSRGSGGRALVHFENNVLALNFAGDFTGGTLIGNDVFFKDEGNSYIASGNLGLGTTNPKSKLEITDWTTALTIGSTKNTEAMVDNEVLGAINFYKHYNIGYAGAIKLLQAGPGNNYSPAHLAFYTNGGGNVFTTAPEERLRITSSGNVGIGTTNPTSKLTVAGNINSREVKVTVDAGADFVFENNYNLPSLDVVDKFIKENKHLPEIASADEMKKDGINLSEMNIKLLQKIEELTLYAIDQNKKIELQSKEIESLKDLVTRVSKIEIQLNQK